MRSKYKEHLNELLQLNNTLRKEKGIISDISNDTAHIFAVSSTKYYLNLIEKLYKSGKESDAERMLNSIFPQKEETNIKSDIVDGIGEDSTVPGYPLLKKLFFNRILLMASDRCPVNCRYCFRRRNFNQNNGFVSEKEILRSVSHIDELIKNSLKNGDLPIDEVILSGGEPLTISYLTLEKIVFELCKIDAIKTYRIDTKLLSVDPGAFDLKLIKLLSKLKTTYIINHFIHSEEITDLVVKKVNLLLKYGIITGAHIPIINGVNEKYSIIKNLVNSLYANRIRPYYLIHFIPTKWTEHFRVPLEESIKIRERLLRECSGFSVPNLVVYLPDGKGKAIINSMRDVKKIAGGYLLANTLNEEVVYEEKT